MGSSNLWHWLLILAVAVIPAAVALIVVKTVGHSERKRQQRRDDTRSGPKT